MMQPRIKMVQCLSPTGLHRMAYQSWGDDDNPRVLVCVHGVTRVSDDFDRLAESLSEHYRVICPDVVGRGRSDWLRDPRHYIVPQYVSDMVTLIARLDVAQVDWVGTSMGGLIGMGLAALPDSPVRKMVINDIGPNLNFPALSRIGEYIAQDVRFDSVEAGRDYIRTVSAPFGPHSDDEWDKLARDVLRKDSDGRWRRHYDLAIAKGFEGMTEESTKRGEAALWATYDAIRAPVLLVRGSESDLLTRETAQAMTERGPRAQLAEISGVGHAPTFMHDDQIALVKHFLLD
jgi:pimeloyl-ACP methyl ester carboxylesterase